MTELGDGFDAFDDQLANLENNLTRTVAVTAAFQAEIGGVQSSLSSAEKDATKFSNSLSGGLRGAIGDLVFEGDKLSDVLRSVAQSMVQTTFNRAITPLTDAISGAITSGIGTIFGGGAAAFEKGGAFSQGRVLPFAKGGVVTAATTFPMRNGVGLMGEAGPEAIMPLSRGSDGTLGVRTNGAARNVTVNMNISTPNAESFQRSRSQIAANISRAIQSGQRNF